MKRILVAIILLITALFISTCSDSDDDNNETGVNVTTFSLQIGTTWRYLITEHGIPLGESPVDTVSYYVVMTVDSLREAPDGTMTTALNCWDEDNSSGVNIDYVANMDDGLRILGSEGIGPFIVFANRRISSDHRNPLLPGDYGDLEWYTDLPDSNANLILPYPANAGFSWSYQPEQDGWIASQHEIIGTETIETAVGSQSCIHKHISISFGEGEDYGYDYYYSSKGVVYAWFDYGMQEQIDEYGNNVGDYHAWIKYELVEYTPGR